MWFGESHPDMYSSVKGPIIVIVHIAGDLFLEDFWGSEDFFCANVSFPSQKLMKPMGLCLFMCGMPNYSN